MLIGKRLKELRLTNGLTQDDLGKILNVSKSTICFYEKEVRIPSLQNLIDISDYFEVTIDYLLGRDVLIKDEKTQKNIFISNEEFEKIINKK